MEQRLMLEGGGWLEVREQGAQVRLSVCRELDGAGLYKARLRGEGGEYLLGTLLPDGRYLHLERTVSKNTLSSAGCWPVLGGICDMVFSFTGVEPERDLPAWHWEHRPGQHISDPVLSESASAWGSMLIRLDEDGFQLAVPFNPNRPFPLTPLFCLAGVQFIDGAVHTVFSFHSDGAPRFPDI